MKEKKGVSKKVVVFVFIFSFLISLLIISAVGFFIADYNDKNNKKYNLGKVIVNYPLSGDNFKLSNLKPMKEEDAIKQIEGENIYDFTVITNLEDSKNIDYEIVIKYLDENIIDKDSVMIYLEELKNGSYVKSFGPEELKTDDLVIKKASIDSNLTSSYRLHVWIKEGTTIDQDKEKMPLSLKIDVKGTTNR